MTLGECLQRADALRPNSATEAEKAAWVLQNEAELGEVFLPRYQDPVQVEARRWPEDRGARLLASGPFEELYIYRLLARLELMDQEWEAYNIHTAMANQLESQFKKAWHRGHTQPSGGVRL